MCMCVLEYLFLLVVVLCSRASIVTERAWMQILVSKGAVEGSPLDARLCISECFMLLLSVCSTCVLCCQIKGYCSGLINPRIEDYGLVVQATLPLPLFAASHNNSIILMLFLSYYLCSFSAYCLFCLC